MTFFHHIDPIEQRALALPRMRPMLEALAAKHASLFPYASAASVRAAMEGRKDNSAIKANQATGRGHNKTSHDKRPHPCYV